jgi:O-antigen/teichoic acid export membrane protein
LILGVLSLLALTILFEGQFSIIKTGTVYICLIGYVIFTSLSSLLSRLLVAQYRLKHLSIINVATAFLQLITVYVYLSLGYSLNQVLIIVTLTSFLFFILCLVATFKEITLPKQFFDLKPLFLFGKNSWLTSLVEFGLGKQVDIILIGYFIAVKSEVGFYNLAISTVIILSGFTTAGLGGVSEIEKKWGISKLKIAWNSLIKLEYLLSVPLIVFLVVYAHQIIKAIYTEAYLPAAPMIQLYASFFILQRFFGGGIHITAFYAMEKAKVILIARFIGGTLNLIFNLILIPLYGGMGAIIATGFSVLVTVIIEYLCARKYISKIYPYQFIFKVSISIIAALSILSVIEVESFISIIYAALIYGLLLSLMFYIFKPFDKNDQNIIHQLNLSSFKYLKIFCS